MRTFQQIFAAGSVAAFAFFQPTYAHAADNWFACQGNVSITPSTGNAGFKSETSERTLVADDTAKTLHQWTRSGKVLYPFPTHSFTNDKITFGDRSWSGSLDRTNMKFQMETFFDGLRKSYSEKCQPTQPWNMEPRTAAAQREVSVATH